MGLSRITTIEGLYITDLCEDKIAVNTDVQREMHRLWRNANLDLCISPNYMIWTTIYDMNNLNTNVNIFSKTRFSNYDDGNMYALNNYKLFKNDDRMTNNNGRSHGGMAFFIHSSWFLSWLPIF